MKLKNVLVFYKRSAYKIYFLERNSGLAKSKRSILSKEIKRFEQAHDEHYRTLKAVAKVLLGQGIHFTECNRGRNIDYAKYDLVVTVGGDGTFLEAARQIRPRQMIIGVNSSPTFSVGQLCIANAGNFENILKKIITNKAKITYLQRLTLKNDQTRDSVDALNDILVCHRNPAMLCRYYLKVKNVKEEQRSSGVWISTPTGSSGAIFSAGGKRIPTHLKKMQYLPRELYGRQGIKYKLKGGLLNAGQSIEIISLMRDGMVYVDGAHAKYPFQYGSTLKVKLSKNPLKTITYK